jgi:hypothetical protein
VARLLERRLFDRGCQVYLAPGDADERVLRALFAYGMVAIVVRTSAETAARLSDIAVRMVSGEDRNLAVEDLVQRLTYIPRPSAAENLEGDGI